MNDETITNALDAALSAIRESTPWAADLLDQVSDQDDQGCSTVTTARSHVTASRTAVAASHPSTCTCTPLLHALPPVVLYGPPIPPPLFTLSWSGSIPHFPTCRVCGCSYKVENPCH